MPKIKKQAMREFSQHRFWINDIEDGLTSPEHRLWFTVITDSLVDYQELIQKRTRLLREPIIRDRALHYVNLDIRTLTAHIHDPWFKTICDYCNVQHEKVLKVLEKINRGSIIPIRCG